MLPLRDNGGQRSKVVDVYRVERQRLLRYHMQTFLGGSDRAGVHNTAEAVANMFFNFGSCVGDPVAGEDGDSGLLESLMAHVLVRHAYYVLFHFRRHIQLLLSFLVLLKHKSVQ